VRENYILIDYENIQPESFRKLDQPCFKVLIFLGANQTKIPFELVSVIQQMGSHAEYLKVSGTGPNAADFHIAFYIGQLSEKSPGACFHIISKDKGFDPLIEHLKSKKIWVKRSLGFDEIPLIKVIQAKSFEEKLEIIRSRFQPFQASKPRTLKTLSSTINALFQKQLGNEEIESLIKGLQKSGEISVNDSRVEYAFSGGFGPIANGLPRSANIPASAIPV
jgi:hypothetical protein